jgi:iron complex outermembrane recepter protein
MSSTARLPSRYANGCMLLAALLTSFLCLSIPVLAHQPFGQITGEVRDATGAALVDVTIDIRGAEHRVARSGLDGTFGFRELPPGPYEIRAALAGFAAVRRSVRVSSSETASVSLTLTVEVRAQTVVTAGKSGERDAASTPMAVSVLTGADLQRAHAHTVAQVAGLAPSVTFSQNSDFAQLTIRGIGTNVVFAGSDPSSAVYLDGVYLARPVMALADFLDLDRVEVVRGPQGTLYGRNAVGGALNLVTRAPTNELDSSARLQVGTLGAARADARVSGPIVRDRLLGSAAVLRGVRDGFVRDVDHPGRPLGGEDVTAASGKLHWVLDRRTDIMFSGDVTHQDPIPLTYAKVLQVKPGFQVDNPAHLHEVRTSTPAEGRIMQSGGALRLTSRWPHATTLTSLTAFRALDYRVVNDADITELNLTSVDFRDRQHQWSQELTLAQQRPRLTWLAGVFVLGETDHEPVAIQVRGPRLESRIATEVEGHSAAAFGQVTVEIASRVSGTAGLRYTRERKNIANAGVLFTMDLPVSEVPGTAYAYTDAIESDAWTPRFGLEARLGADTFGYVSATRGFKSGGFNITSREAGLGFAPEWAWSYEGGVKARLGRAILNAAAFHVDYTDMQVQTAIRPGIIDISNAAESTIRGVELEGATRVAASFHAGGHVAWLDTRFDRYVAVGVGGITGDVAGNRLSNAPEWSGRLWLEWTRQIGGGPVVSARVDARSQSTVYFTPFNDAIQRQSPYALLDARVEAGPPSRHWAIEAWARNLTDTGYINGTFSTPPPAIGGRPGVSREIGVQLTLRWTARSTP